MTLTDGTFDTRYGAASPASSPFTVTWKGILNVCVLILMSVSSIILIEPAPYEFMFLVTMVFFFAAGVRIPVAVFPILLLTILYTAGGLLALTPFIGERVSVQFTLVSIYLTITMVFFAVYVSEDTEKRLKIIQNGYIFAAFICAVAGLIGYLKLGGLGDLFSLYDRAAGTTKDPNVFGAFMVPPTVFLLSRFLRGGKGARPLNVVLLGFFTLAIFVSFSRGAWGNFAGSSAFLFALMFLTTQSAALRWRILLLGTLGLLLLALIIAVALSFDNIREAFLDRFTLGKEYDVGINGRFGKQVRSIPLLLDSPNGFGPLKFSQVIPETEPHNTFINAFSNYGWLGGIAFLALIVGTWFIGWQLVFMQTPWQNAAIAIWCCTFMQTLQCFQIDVDHWRHFFLLIGLTWGLFAASQVWLRQQAVRHS